MYDSDSRNKYLLIYEYLHVLNDTADQLRANILLPPHSYLHIIFPYGTDFIIGFGGLGVACWPLVPKFAGSDQPRGLVVRVSDY